jgi:FkbM family methyltransferase
MSKPPYYSQYGQDRFLDRAIFNKKRNGYFIDIGAHDGVAYSNSFFFEKERGWRGICFEPNPNVFSKLKANRKCDVRNECVSNKTGKVSFMVVSGWAEMLSGIVENYDQRHLKRIDASVEKHGGEKAYFDVECIRLDQINLPTEIDYINIDVEGSELKVLEGIDFDTSLVKVLTIENNYNSAEIGEFMLNRGYKKLRVLGDEIYVKESELTFKMKSNIFIYDLKSRLGAILFWVRKFRFMNKRK